MRARLSSPVECRSIPLSLAIVMLVLGAPPAANCQRPPRTPAATTPSVARAGTARPELRGFVIGVFSDAEGERWQQELDEVQALGVNTVLVIVQQAMPTVRSTEIVPRAWLTPSDARLERVLAGVKSRGLKLVLMPTLYIEETDPGEWRGTLAPRSWTTWWESYDRFVLHHARLAERHGADIFCVGSELCSVERHRERWADLIRRVRAITASRLTYSFNWDHLGPASLTRLLDYAGLNLYHDLGSEPGTSVAELALAWNAPLEEIRGWQAAHGIPLLVTEVGFRSVVGAELAPWDYLQDLEYDGEAQARCYEALLGALPGLPDLAGIQFYSWRGAGGIGDTTYTPRGKPAEALLRRWLSGDPSHVASPLPAAAARSASE